MTLKEFRERRGLNQRDMAKAVGVSYSYYTKVETGQKNPGYGFLKNLKVCFPGFDLNDLFK